MPIGSGQHPPSEIYHEWYDRRIAMQMRTPVHVWAMLSRGREAQAANVYWGDQSVKGVDCCERWQEWDGEGHWKWRDRGSRCPEARQWTQWRVRRMVWVRRDGVWRGEWDWEEYDRENEWFGRHRRRDEKNRSLTASRTPWGAVPLEVLLGMVLVMKIVSTCLLSMSVLHTELFCQAEDYKGLATTSRVCRAWLKISAPALYRRLCHWIDSSRVKELVEDVSKPGSRIAKYAERLTIHGPLPWVAFPKLLKLLPRLVYLSVFANSSALRPGYHPTLLCLMSTTHIASRTPLALTELRLYHQSFSSPADVLRLLACFPFSRGPTSFAPSRPCQRPPFLCRLPASNG